MESSTDVHKNQSFVADVCMSARVCVCVRARTWARSYVLTARTEMWRWSVKNVQGWKDLLDWVK